MTIALAISTLVAWQASNSTVFIEYIMTHQMVFFGLIIAQFAAVIALAGWVNKMSFQMAVLVFLGYAALTGLTLSTIFLVYTAASIAKVFVVSSLMFGTMSLYGYTTKKDLSGWGSFLFMSLIGIILASVVNFFLHSPMIEWMVSVAGVIIFAGLAAYDHQKLKAVALMDPEGKSNLPIRGALTLYLDFINLFLMLLRLMGNRR